MLHNTDQTRVDLAKQYFKGQGVEVGVEQGAFSEEICTASPGVKLFCVDAWKAYKGYRDHTRQAKLDRFYEITRERLAPYHCYLIRQFSQDAVLEFEDESLDFIYIDANHSYDQVAADIKAWIRKVKPHGVIAGHDYIRRKGQDQYYAVVNAVNDYVEAHKIKDLTIYRGDEAPSWMFFKP